MYGPNTTCTFGGEFMLGACPTGYLTCD
jgi:hypothetical protein